MRFGVFYEHQLPRPWADDAEQQLFHEALEQVEIADEVGIDVAWAVEHHFLEEYSHSSAPEVFLAACAARTRRIRLGHGIRHTPPAYNHPARTAESIATLDVISRGRVELGIGEGATRLELGAFGVPARAKRAMSLEAGEQIANMLALSPYPGFDGDHFTMPCRNVIPKPVQKPHPPMWVACTNRSTIEMAARLGLGALAFAFVDPEEARHWVDVYYDLIKSDECVPLGHTVNPNIAIVTGFSLHHDRAEAIRRGFDGFHFFAFALASLVTHHTVPGHTDIWERYEAQRGDKMSSAIAAAVAAGDGYSDTIGTPADATRWLRDAEATGIDHVIFLQQGGRNRHEHICESLRLFGDEVLPEFTSRRAERDARKADELAPHIEAALARKEWMEPLEAHEVPVVEASVAEVVVPSSTLT
ncbi:MAG: LLM class flavin-dependent oxidoreductase [Acidimicrobiales bacterium]